MRTLKPIPKEVRDLFDYLLFYASTGNLGVISALDKATGDTRFALLGRHETPDGEVHYVPLGFLTTTAGDEVFAPNEEPSAMFVLEPDRWDEFLLHAQIETDRWADDGGATHDRP